MTDRDRIARIIARSFEEGCKNVQCSDCPYYKYGKLCEGYLYADSLIEAWYEKVIKLYGRKDK